MILPFGIIGSTHVLEYRIHRIHSEPKFKDDTILPHSRGPRSPDTFWTEVQGWCNPTTFLMTEVTLDPFWTEVQGWYNPATFSMTEVTPDPFWTEVQGWYNPAAFSMTKLHWIRSKPKFKDDTIIPHSRESRSLDTFWTEVQGWCNPPLS